MGYVGVPPQSGFITTAKQRVTSSTNNYVDLDQAISNLSDVIVWVNFVKQDSTNLSLTTSTRITLGGTLVASDIVEIAYLGKAVATQNPSTNSVTNDMLVNSSITLNGSAVSLGGSATVGGDNTPAFNVKLSSNQDVSSGTTTVVAFNSEQVDTDNDFNTTTYRFVPQTAGKYFIAFTIYALTASAGNGNLRAITANIRKNGSNQTQVVQDYNNSFTRQGCATTTAIIDMNGSTDYIDFTADATAGSGDGRFENHTRANGFLLIGA